MQYITPPRINSFPFRFFVFLPLRRTDKMAKIFPFKSVKTKQRYFFKIFIIFIIFKPLQVL